jgi:squalene-associated FAD-dependent desaturase
MSRPRVAVVGGGLAGLAAAVALSDAACDVHLFEARRQLGGRATSFRDPATGALVDFCQHVSMGCCTNLADFCRRTLIDRYFRREHTLYFVGPDGRIAQLAACRWLPAPFHLAPALLRLPFLSLGDRWRIARGLLKLARTNIDVEREPDVATWLRERGQTAEAIERFWSVVLVSALGETLDRVSLSAAKKVFVDGFMANRAGYEVVIPQRALSELFDQHVSKFLVARGVSLHLGTVVEGVGRRDDGLLSVRYAAEAPQAFDQVIVAVPWRQVGNLIAPELRPSLPWLEAVAGMESSPITGVHLWFDREITRLPHAVLISRLSQWVFNRGEQMGEDGRKLYYYQVVISATRALAGQNREELVERICGELKSIWPVINEARLINAKVVTEQHAVFSMSPDLDRSRPSQTTSVPGLLVAGDWTATGWPSTMEGAVRSGYLAAEGVLGVLGQPGRILVDQLPVGWLARRLGIVSR